MKRMIVLIIGLALASSTGANIMPTALSSSAASFNPTTETVDLCYRLNEAAGMAVAVEIYNASEQLVRTLEGTTDRGLNTVTWDGKNDAGEYVPNGSYYFKVIASDFGHSDWEVISTDTLEAGYIMYSGKALKINKNPDSPHYGKVYITNTIGGTSINPGATEQLDGIYVFWPDGTPVTTYIDTINFGGNTVDGSGSSPWWLAIGPDDHIYISDWKDGYENVWEFDADMTPESMIQILSKDHLDNHGNVCGMAVRGTGENRVLYTTDEDLSPGWSIWKYEIGTLASPPYITSPGLFIEGISGMYNRQFFDFTFTSNGDTLFANDYVSSVAPGVDLVNLSKWYVGGAEPETLWTKLQAEGTDPTFRRITGIDYDELHGRLAASCRTSWIFIFNSNGDSLHAIENSGTHNRGCVFDAVGNIYVVNSSNELWRVWSPPDGINASTTKSPFAIEVTGVGVEEDPQDATLHFAVWQNLPNPFSSETRIVYTIPYASHCIVRIYDLSGGLVHTLVDEQQKAGIHEVCWDGKDGFGNRAKNGIYFYRVTAGTNTATRKLVLMR